MQRIALLETLSRSLAAVALASVSVWAAQLVARRLLPRAPALVQWLGGFVVAFWGGAVLFGILSAVGAFALPWGVSSVVALSLAVFLGSRGRTSVFAEPGRAYRLIARFAKRGPSALGSVLLLFSAVSAVRCFIMPPLGWDTITYHAFKAALWVQTGTFQLFDAPGGWSAYRLYPGGAEAITAWALLVMRNDVLAGLVDFIEWVGLVVALGVFCRELGVRAQDRLVTVGFVATLPAFRLLLGSGYNEPLLCFLVVASLAFALRFCRTRNVGDVVVASAALGLAPAVKIYVLPLVCAIALVLATIFLASRRPWSKTATGLVSAALAFVVPILPWLVQSYRETGYPLSPFDVRIGPLTLGVSNDALRWYVDRPMPPESREVVWGLAKTLFALPGARNEAFGVLGGLTLPFVPLGVLRLAKRRISAAALIALACGISVWMYASPSLAVVRHYWSVNSSRFLLPAMCIALPVGMLGAAQWGALAKAVRALVRGALLYHLVYFATVWWSERDAALVARWALIVALAFVLVRECAKRLPTSIPAFVPACFMAVVLLTLRQLGFHDQRLDLVETGAVFYPAPRHWLNAARAVDTPGNPHVIAMTAGPHQNVDSMYGYYFLGERFQNEVLYVPVTVPATIPALEPSRHFERQANYDVWLERLRQARVTHVIAFDPTSLELLWMEAHPETFEWIEGGRGAWGLFRFRD